MRIESTGNRDYYFTKQQKLMTRFREAKVTKTLTLFFALAIKVPENFKHFVVNEVFQPVKTFSEPGMNLEHCNDSKRVQPKECAEHEQLVMKAESKKKKAWSFDC